MYKKYKASVSSCTSFGYPNYSWEDPEEEKKKPKLDLSKPCKEYHYGKDRKKKHFWERDHELKVNAFNKWKKTTLEDDTDEPKGGADKPKDDPKKPKDDPKKPKDPARPGVPAPPPPPRLPTPPPKPKPPAEKLKRALHVEDIDLQIPENTQKHRTEDYACTEDRDYQDIDLPAELVLRRGDTFTFTVTFDRPYDKNLNELQLVFSLGDKPTPSRGTLVKLFLDESGKRIAFRPDKWGAILQGKKGNDITILANIPCNCIIGDWSLTVKLYSEETDEDGKDYNIIWQYTHDMDITILFNPWCEYDAVHMPHEIDRQEYTLNDNGCVYRGNWKQVGAKEWNFGQFEEEILDIAMSLVRSGFKGGCSKQMSDPVAVTRVISKMVNCCDDNGVLVGNWSGDYADGVSPSKWSGSIKILKLWRKSGPVKFGQCWVFSCLTTTVCRALGIPCRTVTNFASAHDTNASNCIEAYYIDKANNKKDDWLSGDSVWNFHVWNEVWMTRPDLIDMDPEYEFLRGPGWQVIDATPQETSEGVFQCGPAPLAAIRIGYCHANYDTDFVFSEVNADKIHYEMQSDGEYKRTAIYKHSVGKMISTKIADGKPYRDEDEDTGSWDWFYNRDSLSERKRHDVTLDYKPPEGSEEERKSVRLAQKTARQPLAENYMEETEEKEILDAKPVECQLLHGDGTTMIGSPLTIQVTAKNDGYQDKKIKYVETVVTPKTYTGSFGAPILDKYFDGVILKKGEELSFDVTLEPKDYLSRLVEQANISVVAIVSIDKAGNEPSQLVTKEHEVRFRRPDLAVKCPAATKRGEKVNFEVSFKNPLDEALTGCDISMESAGFKDIDDEKEKDIPPNGEYRRTFCLKANKKAKKHASLTFSFDCKQLKDISGGCSIKIKK